MTDDGAGAKATVTKEEEGICEAEVALGQCLLGLGLHLFVNACCVNRFYWQSKNKHFTFCTIFSF